jgi:hypothetical protein
MTELLTVSETTESKQFWLQQGLGKGHELALEAADALIVPEKDFRDGVAFVFHQDTTTLYKFLSTKLTGAISIEICSNDEEYLDSVVTR